MGRVAWIVCECEWCRHEASIELKSLIDKMGADAKFREMSGRLVCSKCGWRIVEARPVWPQYRERATGMISDRPPAKAAPLPALRECREVLAAARVRPGARADERHSARMCALMDRWPDLGASRALFIVRSIGHERGRE